MDKLEYRSVIRFLVLEGVTPTEIYARMLKAYGEELTPSPSTVKKWASEFKRGRTSIKDDPREGRPKCATGADVVKNVFHQVIVDRRLKVREIADAACISTGSAFEILTKQLHLRKLYGRWVPTLLTEEQKSTRVRNAELCLSAFNNDTTGNDFERRCVTVGETWIHIYKPQIKGDQISPPPVKVKKVSTSSEKVLALIFWDAQGVLLIDYIERERDVNGEYYANLLEALNEALLEKRNLVKDGIFFYQDVTPTDRESLVQEKFNELKYTILEQPPQSPDLSPSDYHLFPKLENFLQAKRFTTVEEAISAVDKYLDDLPISNFKDGILSLGKHWSDCIAHNGNYIEPNSNSNPASENDELYTREGDGQNNSIFSLKPTTKTDNDNS